MEEVSLNETETRYYSDLFLCCDEEKCGKIPMLKATELYRSANIPNDKILEIISLSGIPSTALHISRAQFYSCLKLIAAHQAGVLPLRQELIAASVQLPLPRFTWHDNSMHHTTPPPLLPSSVTADRRNSLQRHNDWLENHTAISNHHNHHQQQQHQHQEDDSGNGVIINSDVPSTDSEIDQCESSYGGEEDIMALEKSGNNNKAIGHGINVVHKNVNSTHRRRSGDGGGCSGSPEAWSTNSDSPTPTNSVAERPWVVKESLWHGLLGDEHRQLLGTEEESSDRHSSDDENETDLEAVYQITPEQREYYYKQFKMVQHDNNGLLSGHVARVFFEKSRIPVEELRHIWQLCDVTRDGALSLTEFIAAMHLVVLRRNNIPLPAVLPNCLHPNILQYGFTGSLHTVPTATVNQEPPEADLLHLDDDDGENIGGDGDAGVDDDEDKTDNTIIGSTISMGSGTKSNSNANNSRLFNDKNIMNLSTLSTASQTSISSRQSINTSAVVGISSGGIGGISNIQQQNLSPPIANQSQRSMPNSPKVIEMLNITPPVPPPPPPPSSLLTSTGTGIAIPPQPSASGMITATTTIKNKDRTLWTVETQSNQWTKFTESPISNVSSPGPKPLNFDMQRTAQAVVSDPQILHPVPLRVTPVAGGNIVNNSSSSSSSATATMVPDKMSTEIIGDNTLLNEDPNAKSISLGTSVGGGIANTNTGFELTNHIVSNNINTSNNNNNNNSSIIKNNNAIHYRDSMQSNEHLRAIQRPQAKKLPSKNIGAIPPPPQREPSIGNSTAATASTLTSNELNIGGGIATTAATTTTTVATAITGSYMVNKKEPPPIPPPRPSHRHHGRSSSLDLNKFKIITNGNQGQEITAQTSFDLQTSSGFADFAQFSDNNNDNSFTKIIDIEDSQLQLQQQQLHSLQQINHTMQTNNATAITNTAVAAAALGVQPLTRFALQSNQRVSAFEVYRKPATPRNSLSPQRIATTTITMATIDGGDNCGVPTTVAVVAAAPQPFGSAGAAAMTILPNAEQYEKRVNAISETLRHVSFKQENNNTINNAGGGGGGGNNMTDVLKHLREQNHLLMRLCNDLSDELLTVHTRKEELRLKLESLGALATSASTPTAVTTPATISTMQQQQQQQIQIQSLLLPSSNHDTSVLTPLSIPTTIMGPHQDNNMIRMGSSISAPVTANVTGGSGSSGVHSNV